MTPVSHGKPCAGNPHARFDEGASASEEPRRNALLHKKTLEVLNKLVAERVIRDYAIGGAMGALWYMEAITTMDLDIFVLFFDETLLDPISPI